MKKEEKGLGENLFQVDKIMRQMRREKKMEKKAKQVKQARKLARLGVLAIWLIALSGCSAVKKQQYRSERDSLSVSQTKKTMDERRSQSIQSLFESLSWQEDRQSALIRSDSSITLNPDGTFQMQQGTVLLRSARRQENAARSEQERDDIQSVSLQMQHQEEAYLSEELKELEKKKPPGAMLLLPALILVFAFLVLIRKVRS